MKPYEFRMLTALSAQVARRHQGLHKSAVACEADFGPQALSCPEKLHFLRWKLPQTRPLRGYWPGGIPRLVPSLPASGPWQFDR